VKAAQKDVTANQNAVNASASKLREKLRVAPSRIIEKDPNGCNPGHVKSQQQNRET